MRKLFLIEKELNSNPNRTDTEIAAVVGASKAYVGRVRNRQSIPDHNDLIVKIRAHVFDAGKAEQLCAKHRLQAGWSLNELREAVEAKGLEWWPWYSEHFTGYIESQGYAEKLMKQAEKHAEESQMATHVEKHILSSMKEIPVQKAQDIVRKLVSTYGLDSMEKAK